MYILLSHHTWNLSEVRYSRHHYPTEASPRRGLTHVWPPANHTKDTPTPIYKPSAHIRRRPPRNAWPEAIHMYNPDVDERKMRESSLGSTAPLPTHTS
ncbi:hypothetical protein [Muribaculum caecicola]|uniref:Uncharacterized protein n=1 Tax=Muribaculum caecicola TaxID=3038144 RepID=A0AC61S409_9BACT|nr:hypothetical protein [Muribaculum caecicola]THG46109.1 hypothetical protein E5990_08455 [Muribaculum caecicola]